MHLTKMDNINITVLMVTKSNTGMHTEQNSMHSLQLQTGFLQLLSNKKQDIFLQ